MVPIQGVITHSGRQYAVAVIPHGRGHRNSIDTPIHAAAGGIVLYAGLAVAGRSTSSQVTGNCVVILHKIMSPHSMAHGHGTHGLAVIPAR